MKSRLRFLPLALAALPFALAWTSGGKDAEPAYAAELGESVPGLNEHDEALFVRGRRLFRWKLWPPSRGAEGINSTECTECHLDPAFGGTSKDKELLVAMVPDENDISGEKVFHRISLSTGRRREKRELPTEASLRRIPSLWGLGLLEAVSDEDLRSRADPEDKDGDGISGRLVQVDGGLGRFGFKGSVSTIERFVIKAFKNELGMNVEPFDQPDFSRLGTSQVRAVTAFIRLMGAPKPDALKGAAKTGFDHFKAIGCSSCHVPTLITSEKASVQLRNKKAEAFTDMLLHDMGPGAAQPAAGNKVNAREFRTPPLWGIGKVGAPYWHDASATTLDEAIRKHEGEGTKARDGYLKLDEAGRKAVMAFLESL